MKSRNIIRSRVDITWTGRLGSVIKTEVLASGNPSGCRIMARPKLRMIAFHINSIPLVRDERRAIRLSVEYQARGKGDCPL
jgi:hypothetical protein